MSGFRRRLMMAQEKGNKIPSKNGFYILDIDGKYWTKDTWNVSNNMNAVGVAIVNYSFPDKGFVISGSERNLIWSKDGVLELVPSLYTTENKDLALNDVNGIYNTQIIINRYGLNSNYAAGYCISSILKNGISGYLGSLGEYVYLRNNRDEINSILSLISLPTILSKEYYWTSTQYGTNHAWIFNGFLYSSQLIAVDGYKSFDRYVLPLFKLK